MLASALAFRFSDGPRFWFCDNHNYYCIDVLGDYWIYPIIAAL